MKFRKSPKQTVGNEVRRLQKVPAIYDWIPFVTGFLFALIWIFIMFYGMDYSSTFFSKNGNVGEIPTSGWLKLFIPIALLGLFFFIYSTINRFKENISRENFRQIQKARARKKLHQ